MTKRLFGNPKHNRWSEGEVEILRVLYPNPSNSIDDILFALPKRSYSAIYSKANSMKLPLRSEIMQNSLDKLRRENYEQTLQVS